MEPEQHAPSDTNLQGAEQAGPVEPDASAVPSDGSIDPCLPETGVEVEGFILEELLHIGPMTALYRGVNSFAGTPCTVIMCRPHSSFAYRRSFELSRNFQARLDNTALARIIGGGIWNGELPVTLRHYIPGKSLNAYLDVAGVFPVPVCRAVAAEVTAVLAEIGDTVEETQWAGYFHRCLWRIVPHDIMITPRGRLFLLTHGISHHFDVRLLVQKPEVPPYSPTMHCTTAIHSVGALLSCMLDGMDSLHEPSAAPQGRDRDAEALRVIIRRCGLAGDGESGPRFTSLFDLLGTLLAAKGKGAADGAAGVIAEYFTGEEAGGR